MNFSGQIYPDDTIGYIRVASVTGRQPVEPVAIGEFRIGSASHCQLRLGNSDIPAVHTVLSVDREQVILKSDSENPPALVNGVPQTECRLMDGDLVEIADHRLLFRLLSADSRITLDESSFSAEAPTIEQLVERLEEQIELVEELSPTPDKAVLDLLHAVAETSASETPAENGPGTSSGSAELQQIIALLSRQHEAGRIRMESLTEVLNNVVRQQKVIADTLEVMSDRIQAFESGNGFGQRRASA